jgi:hypothetical protein
MIAANVLGVAAVGEIGLAIRFASIMALASGAFTAAWGPYALGLQPSKVTADLLTSVFTFQTALICLVSVGVGSLAPEISVLFGGTRFLGAASAIPGLLFSAGLAGVVYVLTTAAGITHRGSWVAAAAIAGAIAQVATTTLLLPVVGVAGFALGAVVGRLIGAALLWASVGDLVQRSPLPMVALVGGAAGTTVIQLLNGAPQSTFLVRALVAAASGLAIIIIISSGTGLLRWRPKRVA